MLPAKFKYHVVSRSVLWNFSCLQFPGTQLTPEAWALGSVEYQMPAPLFLGMVPGVGLVPLTPSLKPHNSKPGGKNNFCLTETGHQHDLSG